MRETIIWCDMGDTSKGNITINSGEGEIVIFQPSQDVRLDVIIDNETVWLSQQQMVVLFESSKANVSEHIKRIFEQKELRPDSTVRKIRTVRREGLRAIVRTLTYYNLDLIISVGFRVNTKRGIQFRQWANGVLKEYLLKGYTVNNRLMRLEQRVSKAEEKIDFFIKTS